MAANVGQAPAVSSPASWSPSPPSSGPPLPSAHASLPSVDAPDQGSAKDGGTDAGGRGVVELPGLQAREVGRGGDPARARDPGQPVSYAAILKRELPVKKDEHGTRETTPEDAEGSHAVAAAKAAEADAETTPVGPPPALLSPSPPPGSTSSSLLQLNALGTAENPADAETALRAIMAHPRDREAVLKVDAELEKFVANRALPRLQVAKASPFTARVIALLATVYGLDVATKDGRPGMLLSKTDRTAIPAPRVSTWEDAEAAAVRPMKIMQRARTGDGAASPSASSDAAVALPLGDTGRPTMEERTEAYERARARIFAADAEPPSPTPPAQQQPPDLPLAASPATGPVNPATSPAQPAPMPTLVPSVVVDKAILAAGGPAAASRRYSARAGGPGIAPMPGMPPNGPPPSQLPMPMSADGRPLPFGGPAPAYVGPSGVPTYPNTGPVPPYGGGAGSVSGTAGVLGGYGAYVAFNSGGGAALGPGVGWAPHPAGMGPSYAGAGLGGSPHVVGATGPRPPPPGSYGYYNGAGADGRRAAHGGAQLEAYPGPFNAMVGMYQHPPGHEATVIPDHGVPGYGPRHGPHYHGSPALPPQAGPLGGGGPGTWYGPEMAWQGGRPPPPMDAVPTGPWPYGQPSFAPPPPRPNIYYDEPQGHGRPPYFGPIYGNGVPPPGPPGPGMEYGGGGPPRRPPPRTRELFDPRSPPPPSPSPSMSASMSSSSSASLARSDAQDPTQAFGALHLDNSNVDA